MTKELVHCPAAAEHDVTLTEIQRWEDDGGAVAPDVRSRKKRSLHSHYLSTERYRWHAQDDIAAAA
jgi:hypothetical protein